MIADVYVRHDGLAEQLIRTATAAGDRRGADLGRLVLAELDVIADGLAVPPGSDLGNSENELRFMIHALTTR